MNLLLVITREPYSDYYLVSFPDGSSEEVEAPEMMEWLEKRHVPKKMNEYLIGKALDDAWNFGRVEILIEDARIPATPASRTAPRLS